MDILHNGDKRAYSIKHYVTVFLCCAQSDQKMSKNMEENKNALRYIMRDEMKSVKVTYYVTNRYSLN